MAAPGAAAGIPLTAAQGPFGGPAAAANGAGLHAHNYAAVAAAAAAAQQQQNAAVLSSQFHLAHQAVASQSAGQAAVAAALKNSVAGVTSQQTTTVGSSLVSGSPGGATGSLSSNMCTSSSNNLSVVANKLGSPAAKKFRPAFARPSHKGSRYIPKPIPQELGNLKTYSKPISLIYISPCLFALCVYFRTR